MKRMIWIAPLVSFLFFGTQTGQRVRLSGDVSSRQMSSAGAGRASFPSKTATEAEIGKIAEESSLSRIIRIQRTGPEEKNLQIDWESDPDSGFRFLSLLQQNGLAGSFKTLQISPLAGRAEFGPGDGAVSSAPVRGSDRLSELFKPLPIEKKPAPKPVKRKPTRDDDEKRRREEEEKRRMEQLEREKARRLEETRRRLSQNLALTGIVNNGSETLAFIGSQMVRTGDVIDGAVVTSIDETKGEVSLNYKDEFTLVLQLNGPARP